MSKVVEEKYTSEAVAGFTHRTAMEEAARCLLCYDAPCSKGCPAGTDPAKFIRSIRFRNVKGAAETIRENNVLGGTCARVCPYDHLCEEACSRCGIDKPIEIGKLQRYAIEQEEQYKLQVYQTPTEKRAEKIACVGSGPASLACAAELAKNGYHVVIFEREAKAGGVLTYGIVPSRLPQHVVDFDLEQIKSLGIQFVYNKEVQEKDLESYDAVFIGTGLWGTKLPPIKGTQLKGVYAAAQYLKEARTDKEAFEKGNKVVIVGGGDVAVDCAVTAKLLGAEEVRIVYRRTLEEAPGNMAEFQYALSLGIGITTNMAPEEVVGTDHIEKMCFIGRDKKSMFNIDADTVVFAIGQEPESINHIATVDVTDKGNILVCNNGQTSNPKVFAGGDIVNGGKTVVEAVASGKEAAKAIQTYLEQKGVK